MVIWGIRLVTFMTNLIMLISFIWLYVWIDQNNRQPFIKHSRQWLLIGLTTGFLLFFHVDSLLNIANAGHPVGYGWTFLNFQLITMLYALLSTRTRAMTIVMMLIGDSWFILMMAWHQAWWVIFPMLLTVAAHHFADLLTTKRWLYYPFGFLFAIPAYVANYQALNGIDVGWPFLLGGYLLLEFALWETNWQFNSRVRSDRRLKKEASIDSPTGLSNFGQFDKDLQAAFERYQDHNELYSLYTFDIDHFKAINDEFGHLSGNEVLTAVAKHLQRLSGTWEYRAKVYRTGGEEFSVILFHVVESYQRATEISQQLRHELNGLEFCFDDQCLHLTISLGQDRATADDKNYLDLYRRADAFLYTSKNNGRDVATIRGQLVH
jgi:diguanylate cyclase (GGDEF)-like protein